jgi:transposase
MGGYVEGWDRRQTYLLPECLDDYVGEDNPIRVIEAFVDELDLSGLGFERAVPADTGRPGYHPATLLKLYIYGYLNRVQSSRRLEREAGRNVEVMWLTGKLAPDFKTIADFRRDNGRALRACCARFVVLCRQLGLLTDGVVAVDGSRFKAVNTRDKNFTPGAIRHRVEQIEASIERYLSMLDTADRQEEVVAELRTARLTERLERLRQQMRDLRTMERAVEAAPDRQVSLTDPDARAMATNGKGTGLVGYNVQAAVDTKHHLIVAHEVTNVGHDRGQLASMGHQAKEATGADELTVLADRGYFSGEEVLACDQAGIVPIVPKPLTSSGLKRGLFAKQDFVFDADRDLYVCPAGQELTRGKYRSDREGDIIFYRHLTACSTCHLKPRCTPEKLRRIRRWEHERVIETMQTRLDHMPDAMRIRRRTVEHVFGTIKDWMGRGHFLTRRLPNVGAEMSLHVLAYNLKRAIAILGATMLMEAIRI